MTEFEQAVVAEVKRVRAFIAHQDICNSFEFSIEAKGRVSDGDVELKFGLELDYDRTVEGNSIEGVLYEALRRRGWTKTNAPICLPVVEARETDITGDII
jgi:hypothetical protein